MSAIRDARRKIAAADAMMPGYYYSYGCQRASAMLLALRLFIDASAMMLRC